MNTEKWIPLNVIEAMTNQFSVDTIIGRGEYGVVHKGVYNGRHFAVKLLHVKTKQGLDAHQLDDQQFKNQVRNFLRVNHPNIVRLLGYCYETKKIHVKHNGVNEFSEQIYRVLCFEYLKDGSLDKHLRVKSFAPNWSTRYNIIKGVCEGLNYLHTCDPQILHLELKPTNILLDSSMEPKVADFGMSRHFSATKEIRGTRDYMRLEFTENKISSKSDIFSLGAVMIQIMTGPASYSNSYEKGDLDKLRKQVLTKWGTLVEDDKHQVQTCIELAICCVDSQRDNRPSTTIILNTLNMTESHMPTRVKREVERASGNSMGMADITMDAARWLSSNLSATCTWVDKQFASSVLDHIILDGSMEPTNVPLALLQHITEDFSDNREIGRGGFGVVYKGYLQNGSVAIKRLSNAHTIDERLFYRELTFLISVKHENIVRLLGYCASTEGKVVPNPNPEETLKFVSADIIERLLCFEHINNGSLDKYITDELGGLEWHIRYEIIKGICNGLDYLHNEKGIIHRDLKPANILVDDFMVPKITDFGISKLLEGVTHAVTSNTTMAFGYTAPEFILRGEVSFKSDMYSLGIIITELVTGRKGDPDIKNVLRRWRYRWNKSGNYPPFGYQQVTKCIEIASRCLSSFPKKRPNARDILNMLNAIENTDAQINCAGESPVSPISPYLWELLEFDKLELNFPFEINKQIPCSMQLTNVTDEYVAFDIQKPGILEYCIEPKNGVVPPRSKCIVIVTLQAREVAPYHTMCKDDLVARCATVNDGLTAEEIHEEMFNNQSGKLVDEVMLTVVVEQVAIT